MQSFRRLTLFVGLCAALAPVLPGRADAPSSIPHRESAEGQVIFQRDPTPELPVGRQDFVAIGRGTHIGRYTQVGGHDFFLDGTLVGAFETTAADGSTISGVYEGTYEFLDERFILFVVTAEWRGGTGRLEAYSGSGEVVAILDAATGVVEYVTDAEWERS